MIVRTNGICTTQHLSWRMRRTNFFGILIEKRILVKNTYNIYKQKNTIIKDHPISARWPDLITINKKKENLRNCGLYHAIIECSKLASKEYRTRYELVEKVISRELCKRVKFDSITKWYIHKSEWALKIKTHKIYWKLEI